MSEFLLELYSEEIPSQLQIDARNQLKKYFEKSIIDAGIQYKDCNEYSSPTRLSILIKGLPEKMKIKPKKFIYGDGFNGMQDHSPFDGIIVTAGSPVIPKKLVMQLKVGGRLIIPVGKDVQVMTKIIRISENELKKETYGNFRFVPMLKNKN